MTKVLVDLELAKAKVYYNDDADQKGVGALFLDKANPIYQSHHTDSLLFNIVIVITKAILSLC